MKVVVAVLGLLLGIIPARAVGAAVRHIDVRVVDTSSGPVLADADGMTLYVFVDDLLTKAPSACTGDCTNDWPPALVTGPLTVGRGVSGHVGTTRRADGARQLTMDGRPLYRFAGDRTQGDLSGNGIGNVWWAMTPTGLSATSFPAPRLHYGPAASTTLTVVRTRYGPVVANAEGEVLYTYTDDTSTTSACQATWCLVDWPPLQASGSPTASASITGTVATLHGAGGTTQVSLAGHPLYTFVADQRPGDTLGQGIGGDWYLVSPSGASVTRIAVSSVHEPVGPGTPSASLDAITTGGRP